MSNRVIFPLLGSDGGSTSWGSITGNINDQTDLKNALDGKADSSAITGFQQVIDIMDMTQAELLDFYTNYATLMQSNTYVVDGYTFSTLTVTDQQAGTVLVLEYNPRFKDEVAGAANGTIDVTVGVVYILADGTKQTNTLTYNVPQTSSLANVAYKTADNTFTGNNTFTGDTLIGDLNDIALNLTVDTYGMPQIEGYDANTSKGFYINTDGIVFNDANLGDDTGLGITLDGTTGDVTVYSGFGGIDLQASSVTVNGQPIGGGGNDWYGSKEMFDAIPENELDDDTNYYIADRLDYSEIANKPFIPSSTSQITNDSDFTTNEAVNLAIYNAKKAVEDSFVFCTQSEYDTMSLAGTLKEDTKYFIQGTQNKLEMVVTFTDTTTATYNVYVE